MKKLLFFILLLPIVVEGQIITTVAGNGTFGYTGDGGPATNATLNGPFFVAADLNGNIYISDFDVVRVINPAGIIKTIAGNGTTGFSGDNGPATAAQLYHQAGIALDSTGNIYIADVQNYRVRKVNTAGIITTIAGNGIGYAGDNGPATDAKFDSPTSIAVDRAGNLYIADDINNVVRKVDVNGIITTFAGNGHGAGTGTIGGFSGDGGPATDAELFGPGAVTLDNMGNLYIIDGNNYRVRKVNTSGIITTMAGTGGTGYTGDNGPATMAQLVPTGIVIDRDNKIYISDGLYNVIRVISTAGIITTYAGNGIAGYSGDGGPAINAKLESPVGMTIDSLGSLYIADNGNARVRKISASPSSVANCDHSGMSLAIFPNPTDKDLIVVADEKITYISINNLVGQNVYSETFNNEQVRVNIADLPKGIYIVQVTCGSPGQRVIKKIVKE